ncbi:peptidylprolyl isomerase [Nostoc sp. TCL26-01]|uniref:foldase protein PrsA n=1 Tax=Nostoc sp. TCL26-01 TaxID=2576904 RepID=UPI0015B7DA5E|nr:peptidylprolyl isomerase [Nostoc sp. TCL26-01]QLE57355.1 peptidylprolyl isomerase [Nostoc sp. TCL26-01]
MSHSITITNADILEQVKLSGKIPEIIEQIIQRKIIKNTVAEAGIKIETEELQKTADQMRLVNKLISAEDTWIWLNKHGLSLDDFEDIVYTNLISAKLATHLFADKVEAYFYEHQLDYLGVVMYEAMLDDEDLAWELFYAIKEGETSFHDVARIHIQDIELRRKSGYLGIVYRRDLQPEISAAVFAAKPPQLLQPIVTSKGVHLIFVEEIIQPQLNERLCLEIATHLYYEWLKMQSQEAEVKLQIDEIVSNS